MKYITDNQENETGQQFGCAMELDHGLNQYYYAIMEWVILPVGGYWIYYSVEEYPHSAELRVNKLNKNNEK